jgi:hypothetical protein
MIVQWCVKGLNLPDDDAARHVILDGGGIVCKWWLKVGVISPPQIRAKLTTANLNLHVNHYMATDPATGQPFSDGTPFISLSAGTVERDAAAQTNLVHRARRTAAWFGTQFGTRDTAYLFTCWVILAPRRAVEVQGVAEEVRDLNTYRRYSPYQTEGEVTAKIEVPANHVRDCEKWKWDRAARRLSYQPLFRNPLFTPPEQLTNVRELI